MRLQPAKASEKPGIVGFFGTMPEKRAASNLNKSDSLHKVFMLSGEGMNVRSKRLFFQLVVARSLPALGDMDCKATHYGTRLNENCWSSIGCGPAVQLAAVGKVGGSVT